ncbi:MAG: IS630 family transposase [Halieaceae bacterium]|nr:IS630 family transposase [Halieaceae bacterium]
MTSSPTREFLTAEERAALEAVLRKRKEAGLTVRRANALLLLDDGLAAEAVARVLYLDDETIREWQRGFAADGLASIGLKGYKRRDGHLTREQEAGLAEQLGTNPPKTTGAVRTLIQTLFGVEYSISGAIALMHRLGFSYRKPKPLPAGANEAAQAAHIAEYERLLNGLLPDETVVFADAVHPEHQSRPAHGWFPINEKVAVKATTGRKRLNIHGAFNLETSAFTWVEGLRISAETTLQLFEKLQRAYLDKRLIHVFLDNARYHHAKMLRPWLERPECRIKLHFLPAYAPHLNPIERLWGVMHEHVTHNRYYPTFAAFVDAITGFFENTVPEKAHQWRDTITDNFRVLSQKHYRLIE